VARTGHFTGSIGDFNIEASKIRCEYKRSGHIIALTEKKLAANEK
jgi:hypothetical protein